MADVPRARVQWGWYQQRGEIHVVRRVFRKNCGASQVDEPVFLVGHKKRLSKKAFPLLPFSSPFSSLPPLLPFSLSPLLLQAAFPEKLVEKKPSLSIIHVYDRHTSGGAPGFQKHSLPVRSQLRSNKALDRAQSPPRVPREVAGESSSTSELTASSSWVQNQQPQPERLDGSVKAGSVLRGGYPAYHGYHGRAKLTSARRRALSSGSRPKVVNEQINLPADSGPRHVVHAARSRSLVEKKTTGGRRASPVRTLRRKPEYEAFHNSKPLPSHRAPPSSQRHKRDEEVVDDVIEDIVQDVVHASRTLQPSVRTTRTAPLTVKLPLPKKTPSTATRPKRFIGVDNVAGGGGFVSTGRTLPNRIHADIRPIGCLLEVEDSQDVFQETGGRGFLGGRIGSARPGSPVRNSGFVGVRAKGERLVGGGFSASMVPSSPDYPRLCSSRTRRETEPLFAYNGLEYYREIAR
jgi:hypothetical protein